MVELSGIKLFVFNAVVIVPPLYGPCKNADNCATFEEPAPYPEPLPPLYCANKNELK